MTELAAVETIITIADLIDHDTDHDSVCVRAAWAQHVLLSA